VLGRSLRQVWLKIYIHVYLKAVLPFNHILACSYSKWLLIITIWAIFQLYHAENKLHIWWDNDDVCCILEQALLDFYSASSLKQQFTGRQITLLIIT
jgi:hypothetical protein